MFGSGITIRNWSPEGKSAKSPTHVNVYDAVKTKNGPSGLDREGMILVALMSGGDYVPEGIPGCGPKTACEAAKAGFGSQLCNIRRGDKTAIREWRERLQHELKTNESKIFRRRHTTLVIPADFPRSDILGYYTHPVLSSSAELDRFRGSLKWDQPIDFPGLREWTHDAFDWVKLEGAKHFIRSLAPSVLVQGLRVRAEGERFASDNLDAMREDETLLVKAIHGRRQHAVTDHTDELRVSFTPIELVKIDLSLEDPDDAESTQDAEGEQELDALELEDEQIGDEVRKRGPTKFDPSKPARTWILETFVKVGVPLTAQDWEASLRKPKWRATANQVSGPTAPKPKGTRRSKTTGDIPQSSIQQFAKVTKPGVKSSQSLAKSQKPLRDPPAASQRPRHAIGDIVDLLSSSPAKPAAPPVLPQLREKSTSPVMEELPSSVTKRPRRTGFQRSRTLPVGSRDTTDRPLTPPLPSTIDMLDLVSSSVFPSPSQFPAKKSKITSTKNAPAARIARQKSVTVSPSKQTTLNAWTLSSPAGTPSKSRTSTLRASAAPIPALQFRADEKDIETLDLTQPPPAQTTTSRRSLNKPNTRPALQSITSNTSFSSTSSHTSETISKPKPRTFKAAPTTRRTSPRLRVTSASPPIDTLDLTLYSSPLAPREQPPPATSRDPSPSSSPLVPSPKQASPPAPWKSRTTKKRQVILRNSLAGSWDFIDATDSPVKTGSAEVLKGKARRKWRESEIEVLDLC
jgi:Holliday junction resolvase YEN1